MQIYNIKWYSNGDQQAHICSASRIWSLLLQIRQHIVKKTTKYITVRDTTQSSVVFSKLIIQHNQHKHKLKNLLLHRFQC
jgi:hypothetical protein